MKGLFVALSLIGLGAIALLISNKIGDSFGTLEIILGVGGIFILFAGIGFLIAIFLIGN